MPGEKLHQQRFWQEAFVATGLADLTDIKLQATALSHTLYPDQLLARYGSGSAIAEAQYHRTFSRVDDDWHPKPPIYVDADYEPFHTYLPSRDPNSSHQWMKIVEGYNPTDTIVYNAIRRGVREVVGGLSFGFYRVPTLPKQPLTRADRRRARSAKKIVAGCEWVNLHLYPGDKLTRHNIATYLKQIQTHDTALRKLKRGINVLPQIWPRADMTTDEVLSYVVPTLTLLNLVNDYRHLNIWVDTRDSDKVDAQIQHMQALAPYLLTYLKE